MSNNVQVRPSYLILPAIFLIGGILLLSVLVVGSLSLKVAQIILLLFTGVLVRHNIWHSYLLFTFLYPLLPSQPQQFGLPVFQYSEFLLLSFSFWWSVGKMKRRVSFTQQKMIFKPVALLIGFLSLSALLVVLRDNFIFTKIFLLKLQDHSNIFVPWLPGNGLFSLQTLIHLLEGFLFLYITLDLVDSRDKLVLTVKTMLLSAGLVALFGIFQFLFRFRLLTYWVEENPNIIRIHSTMDDPNALGTYMAVLFCLGVYAGASDFSRKNKVYYVTLALILAALGMTVSRAAWGAVFVVFFIVPIFALRFRLGALTAIQGVMGRLARWGWISLILLIILILVSWSVNFRDPHPKSVVEVLLYTLNPSVSLNEVLKGRLDLWKSAVLVFMDFPVLGCGPGMFPRFSNEYPYNASAAGIQENVHNYFLQLLAETGLIGFLLFLFILFHIARAALRNLRSPEEGSIRFGLFSGWIAFLITSLTGHPLLLPKMQYLFWGISGMLVASPSVQRQGLIESSERSGRKNRLFPGSKALAGVFIVIFALVGVRSVLKSRNLMSYEYGYYGWEREPGGVFFRWTKDEAFSIMKAQGNVLVLRFRQLNPEVYRKASRVELYLDERLLDTLVIQDTNWKEWEYYLPETKLDQRIFLRIKPDTVFRPQESGSRDARTLGISLQNIDWKCSLGERDVGTYGWENSDGGIFRWTGKQASFSLRQQGSRLKLSVLPNRSVAKEPVRVEFFWNEQRIHEAVLNQLQWQPITLKIPETAASSGVLTIRASSTWNPLRMGESGDNRELGLAVTPFSWEGTETMRSLRSNEENLLESPSLFGIFNHRNQPYRLLLYKIDEINLSSNFQVRQNGKPLPLRLDLLKSWSEVDSTRYRIYPNKGEPELRFYTTNTFVRHLRLPAGNFIVKVTARAIFGGMEPPLLGIRWNGRTVGGQPVLYSDWQDYFFEVSTVAEGEQELSVRFLNDVYDPVRGMDRNLYVKEISTWHSKNGSEAEMNQKEPVWGWSYQKDLQTITIYDSSSPEFQMSDSDDVYEFERYWRPGLVTITVRAKADLSGEEVPRLAIYVDGVREGFWNINRKDYQEYTMDLSMGGPRRIEAILEKDPIAPTNRSIYISEIMMRYKPAIIVAEPVNYSVFQECHCYTIRK